MKRFFLFALVATVFAACSTDTTQDLAPEIPTAPDELQVSFDEEDTRIQLGENGAPVWTVGDLVSVFYRTNANSKYQFTGETGDVDGTIKLVEEGVATQQTTQIVAVYPYSEDYWFNWNTYDIEASLPAEQTYLKDSFGVGSSIMVSKSDYKQLSFKNVCGWLKLQFTGTGYISKIVLKGNDGEQVAGEIYINTENASCVLASKMGSGEDVGGVIEEDNTVLTSVTLNCGDGVALNSETPTAFYVALPPQTFEKGFTATMYGCDGSTKEISTENLITIERNHILPMASATLAMPIPSNQIWYTSSDGNVVEPYSGNYNSNATAMQTFGANITSNTYENGVGVITFDGDVTTIGEFAFYDCSSLTSVTIPDSVTTIGHRAFYDCSALKSVTIGNGVTTIGSSAFEDCSSLKEVYCKPTTPPSLNGSDVFYKNASGRKIYVPTASVDAYKAASRWSEYADAIVAMPIPSNEIWYTSSDGNVVEPYSGKSNSNATAMQTFGANIVSNTYENGVGVITFDGDVTTIGSYAFYNRDTPTSVTIPNSVTVIGKGAFLDCDALTSITIPDGVTVIEEDVFYSCDALKTVYCKPTTPPSLDGVYVFDFNASDRKIYVPTASVDAYKAKENWIEYADAIEPYNFAE